MSLEVEAPFTKHFDSWSHTTDPIEYESEHRHVSNRGPLLRIGVNPLKHEGGSSASEVVIADHGRASGFTLGRRTSTAGTAESSYTRFSSEAKSTLSPSASSASSLRSLNGSSPVPASDASEMYSSPATLVFSPRSTAGSFDNNDSLSELRPICQSNKRHRAMHDVDGPETGHLPCKKRRLRLHLITSRLSLPFSLPATHILNREADEDTPVLSRFVKFAAVGAKKAGHQTSLVRRAAILNRVRIRVRQAAVDRGHDRIYRMAGMGAMAHGIQLVTASTGAMFPGRSGEQVPGPIVPRAWRPHTTALHVNQPATVPTMGHVAPSPAAVPGDPYAFQPPPPPYPASAHVCTEPASPTPPSTFIITPMNVDDDDASFPSPDLDSRYADKSDDDMDDVYADFGVLFGGGSGGSPEQMEENDYFYEEYLDEVDGITWAS